MTKLEIAARQALMALHDSLNALLFLARDCDMRSVALDGGNEAIAALTEALDNPEERGTSRYEGWVEVAEQAEQVTEGNGSEVSLETEAQEPVAVITSFYPDGIEWFKCPREGTKLYAAPVRTKDLTDDEVSKKIPHQPVAINMIDFARAVIAADREKNK